MDSANLFIAFKADDLPKHETALFRAGEPDKLRAHQQAMEAADRQWRGWAQETGGDVLSIGAGKGVVRTTAEHLHALHGLMDGYRKATGSRVSAGVGTKMDQAEIARQVAEHRGSDRVVLHQPGIEDELKPQAPDELAAVVERVAKAEAAPQANAEQPQPLVVSNIADLLHQHADAQEAHDAEEQKEENEIRNARAKVAQILEQIRAQAPNFGVLRQSAPEAYQAHLALIQGVIQLARALPKPEMKKTEEEIGLIVGELAKSVRFPATKEDLAVAYEAQAGHPDRCNVGDAVTLAERANPHTLAGNHRRATVQRVDRDDFGKAFGVHVMDESTGEPGYYVRRWEPPRMNSGVEGTHRWRGVVGMPDAKGVEGIKRWAMANDRRVYNVGGSFHSQTPPIWAGPEERHLLWVPYDADDDDGTQKSELAKAEDPEETAAAHNGDPNFLREGRPVTIHEGAPEHLERGGPATYGEAKEQARQLSTIANKTGDLNAHHQAAWMHRYASQMAPSTMAEQFHQRIGALHVQAMKSVRRHDRANADPISPISTTNVIHKDEPSTSAAPGASVLPYAEVRRLAEHCTKNAKHQLHGHAIAARAHADAAKAADREGFGHEIVGMHELIARRHVAAHRQHAPVLQKSEEGQRGEQGEINPGDPVTLTRPKLAMNNFPDHPEHDQRVSEPGTIVKVHVHPETGRVYAADVRHEPSGQVRTFLRTRGFTPQHRWEDVKRDDDWSGEQPGPIGVDEHGWDMAKFMARQPGHEQGDAYHDRMQRYSKFIDSIGEKGANAVYTPSHFHISTGRMTMDHQPPQIGDDGKVAPKLQKRQIEPDGTYSEGGPTGTASPHSVGKIKVKNADGKTMWKEVRAGMIAATNDRNAAPIIGQGSHPTSIRNRNSGM